MALTDTLRTADEQQYLETTDQIQLKPGWLQGEGQPLPVMEPYLWRWAEVEPLVLKSGERCGWRRLVWIAGRRTPSPPHCNCCCRGSARRRIGTRPRPSGGF